MPSWALTAGKTKGDVTLDDSQQPFLAQNSVAALLSNGYNIVPALQRCVALKILVANSSRVTSP